MIKTITKVILTIFCLTFIIIIKFQGSLIVLDLFSPNRLRIKLYERYCEGEILHRDSNISYVSELIWLIYICLCRKVHILFIRTSGILSRLPLKTECLSHSERFIKFSRCNNQICFFYRREEGFYSDWSLSLVN